MLKLPTRLLVSCSMIFATSTLAKGESTYYDNSQPTWISDAIAAGWTPPTDQSGSVPATPASLNTGYASDNAGCCDDCLDDCCHDIGNWFDNTLVSFGGEGYKSIGDTDLPPGVDAGYMNSFGLVGTVNTAFGLGSSRVRGQVGASYGAYDFKGRDTVSPASLEQQVFVTAGVYKRSDVACDERISWGLVYDHFFAHQWGMSAGELSVSQLRGILGYALSECNEVGVWGAFHLLNDDSVGFLTPPAMRAMNQANVYWRHNYDFGANSMLYAGVFDPADIGSWQFGFLGEAPLNHHLSLYANFNLALPSSDTGFVGSNEEEWYFGVGLTYSFGGKAVSDTVSGPAGLPLLPVANNGSFLITN